VPIVLSFNNMGRSGRLANQMFQYAALLGIASRHQYEFCIPPSDANDLWNEHQLFQAFDLPELKVIGWKRRARQVRESSFRFDSDLFQNCPDNVDLRGDFQSERYFKDIENQIRKEFQFHSEVEQLCKSAIRQIGHPTISLHVRRTDYLTNSGNHPPCSIDYYQRALEVVPQSLPIIVFSDDIEWCKRQAFFHGSRWVFSHHRSNIVDMCLMSHCSHHVIANSSFSWWGAYLSANSNKIVVAPYKWFGTEGRTAAYDTSDLLPDNWIRV
jgi:hypothetical protein